MLRILVMFLFATAAMSVHAAPRQVHPSHHTVPVKARWDCPKYAAVYAAGCPYIRGYCHGDHMMCDILG